MNTNTPFTIEALSRYRLVSPTVLNGLPGMSSLEVTEITGKRHDHVLRDIRKMLTALGAKVSPDLGAPQFVETQYQDTQGRLQPLTVLNKELTFTLLSRYSFELSNLIVKRWLELEGSGFQRVSIHASTAHLVEREKDNFRAAHRAMGPRVRPRLTDEQKVMQRYARQAARETHKAHEEGRWRDLV